MDGGLTGWLGDFGGFIAYWFNKVVSEVRDIATSISNLSDFFDPGSDSFFLKVAFIPDADFMEDFIGDIRAAFDSKFAFLQQFNDTWDSIKNTGGQDEWEGIKYNNPLIGEVLIVSPVAVNAWSYKIKFWIGGAIVLLTIVMTIRRIGTVAGAGK